MWRKKNNTKTSNNIQRIYTAAALGGKNIFLFLKTHPKVKAKSWLLYMLIFFHFFFRHFCCNCRVVCCCCCCCATTYIILSEVTWRTVYICMYMCKLYVYLCIWLCIASASFFYYSRFSIFFNCFFPSSWLATHSNAYIYIYIYCISRAYSFIFATIFFQPTTNTDRERESTKKTLTYSHRNRLYYCRCLLCLHVSGGLKNVRYTQQSSEEKKVGIHIWHISERYSHSDDF